MGRHKLYREGIKKIGKFKYFYGGYRYRYRSISQKLFVRVNYKSFWKRNEQML